MAPDGEFKVQAGELPAGYDIRSLSWGNTDLLLEPLKIRGTTSSLELRVVLGVKPGAPSVKVSGRVSGAGVGADARITLTGVSMTARFEARLVNGAFEFPKVLPGVYMAAVARNGETFPVTSALVAVAVKDRIGIELVAGPTSMDANPQADAPGKATGAAIVDAFATVPDEMASMKPTHNESEAIANLRMINTAEVTYLATNGGKYGDIPALIAAGLLGSRFKEGFSGYIYTVSAFEGDYIAAAVPQDPKAGRYAFYSTPDAVVRFASSESLAPPGWATMPVQ
jgi:hypothetical protein